MSLLQSVPLWGFFIILGLVFFTGHLLAYRPDPAMGRGRRLAGRWGASLLLLLGLLIVSNRHVGTILPAVVLALLGGVLSGRAAPPSTRSDSQGDGRPSNDGEARPTSPSSADHGEMARRPDDDDRSASPKDPP